MAQQATTQVVPTATSQAGQVAKKQRGVDLLKNMLNAESVQAQFKNALGKNSGTFVASVIDLYNGDKSLQQCEPKAVVMEALKAAVLHLPINKALGYAFIIPFNNNRKVKYTDEQGVERERWEKVMEPTFQIGYKGLIQLAMRTGQYRTLNADAVYEGELRKVNKLTGEIAFDGERTSDKVVGYFCYFELLNGFAKTLYMTVEQMAMHAKRFSKGLKKETTVESLINLAALPVSDSNAVGWMGNFHGMAIKTVIRNLLSKYGYLSVEMQNAIADDYEGETTGSTPENQTPVAMDAEAVVYEDVLQQGQLPAPAAPQEVDPGY
jgi:recombination protein RecT